MFSYLYRFFQPTPISPDQNLVDAIHAYCAAKRPDITGPLKSNLAFTILIALSNRNVVPYVEDFFLELNKVDLRGISYHLNYALECVKDFSFVFGVSFWGISKSTNISWNNIFAGINIAATAGILAYWLNCNDPLDSQELEQVFENFQYDPNYSAVINCKDVNALKALAKTLENNHSVVLQLVS